MLLVASAIMVGCGGGSPSSSTSPATSAAQASTTPASSTAESATTSSETSPSGSQAASSTGGADAAARADAICARRNRELTATTPAGASLSAILATTSRRAAIERIALSELIKITPPTSIAASWRKIVLGTAAALRRSVTLARYAKRTDRAGVARQKTLLSKPQLSLLIAATKARIEQCASVAGPSVRPF